MKTFKPGDIIRAEDVNANFNEVKRTSDAALPAANIRHGKVTVSSVARLGFQNFTVTLSPPMPNANYTVILTLAGSGAYSPEQMTVAAKTDQRTPSTFHGRIRNNGNSAQGCEITYLVIAQ